VVSLASSSQDEYVNRPEKTGDSIP
jgi:hypothetical protein